MSTVASTPIRRTTSTRPVIRWVMAAAAAVTLTACSSGGNADPTSGEPPIVSSSVSSGAGTPTAGSPTSGPASAPPATDSTQSPSASSPSDSGTSSDAAPSTESSPTSGAPIQLGPDDVKFFAAVCTTFPDVDIDDQFDNLTGDLPARRDAAVKLLTAGADQLNGGTDAVQAAGVPNVPGGDKIAQVIPLGFRAIASALAAGVGPVQAATTDDELSSAWDAAMDASNDATDELEDIGPFMSSPEMSAALKTIPECQNLLNS